MHHKKQRKLENFSDLALDEQLVDQVVRTNKWKTPEDLRRNIARALMLALALFIVGAICYLLSDNNSDFVAYVAYGAGFGGLICLVSAYLSREAPTVRLQPVMQLLFALNAYAKLHKQKVTKACFLTKLKADYHGKMVTHNLQQLALRENRPQWETIATAALRYHKHYGIGIEQKNCINFQLNLLESMTKRLLASEASANLQTPSPAKLHIAT